MGSGDIYGYIGIIKRRKIKRTIDHGSYVVEEGNFVRTEGAIHFCATIRFH